MIITDNVYNNKLIHYDSLIDLSRVQVKKQNWYIHDYEMHNYDPWDLRDFYDDVIEYLNALHRQRDKALVKELQRRK